MEISDLDCSGCPKPMAGSLRTLQHIVLESMARAEPLELVMDKLCREAEKLASGVLCSVLSVDREGRLHPLAGPSLPRHYHTAIDDLQIGPKVGSCGSAAFLGEPVEVTDIATDPRWAPFRELALPIGLRACWSSPICAADGRVLGTFAFYYRVPRGASPVDRAIVAAGLDLCAIALEQEERKASIQRLAYFDAVTGVANRASLERHGKEAVAFAIEKGVGATVFIVDLDNFKEVNDTLGHRAGDLLLETVAQRISSTLRPKDFVARIGGDEFAVIRPESASKFEAEAFAAELEAEICAPVDLEGAAVAVGASIGIARGPQDGGDLGELIKKADFALYEVKGNGRGHFRLFDAQSESQISSNRRMRRDISRALDEKQFELHFQPIIELAGGEINALETLIRWRHPQEGLLPPAHFLNIAEKAGIISDIGQWVLKEACAVATSLPTSMRICVNLSPIQLNKPGFALDVANVLASSGLSPDRLELEITESTLLIENTATLVCLKDIRKLGVSIALDDFGTGYSALSHLRAFPVDRIKIDRSFVQEAAETRETASIVRTIIGLAHDLGIKTTAEGVETEEQLRLLLRFGCDEIQGYLISRPKAIDAFFPELNKRQAEESCSLIA
jgi:diguanylate cyclase (GGDEF)-like protein